MLHKFASPGTVSQHECAICRPIALLDLVYKIIAGILKTRIEAQMAHALQKTQYGFRANRSTGDAIQLIRRVLEMGARTHNKVIMILLDWEKAFDKVDREGLMEAIRRMGVDPKLIRLIRMLYKDTQNL